jgi:TPR repeat protein
LEKLDCLEIIFQDDFKALKFYQKACGLNAGSGCSLLGFMHDKGKPKLRATTVKI